MTVSYQVPPVRNDRKAHLIGGGIASLSSAYYLINYGGFQGMNITVYEDLKVWGGAMEASGDSKTGAAYIMRGGRMFDKEAYSALYDLLTGVPSLEKPGNSCADDIRDFSAYKPTDSHARLIEPGPVKIDASKLGLNLADKASFVEFTLLPEHVLDGKKINEFFTPEFFTSNFWFLMRSTFAFQPWHSLTEFRRYCLRFIHEVPKLYNMSGVWRTKYNQYDSIIAPLIEYLKAHGVHFFNDTRVTNLDFTVTEPDRWVHRIDLVHGGVPTSISVSQTDLVFTTLGSLTSASIIGDTQHAPRPASQADVDKDPTWALWKEIAKKQPDFGRPEVFIGNYKNGAFESFSLTFDKNTTFFDKYIAWSENQPGTGALVTFKKSAWGLSLVVPHQPHFANQPETVQVAWAYGLFPDEVGEFVKKPMKECTGEELFLELCNHLGFADDFDKMKVNATIIPSFLPTTMAQFNVRRPGDRPQVVPKDSRNFAFLGQFVEQPEDVVFTVEYSVRCAQIATFTLCADKSGKPPREVTPIYRGWLDPMVMARATKVMILG
ncbi:67 kDa myosin-cross-reactive antigen family protein [Gonapodya prolifera JEL478]|uniref:67 kDa myosin-cross-reactive antigen family protein n=1 Tax=Gonapodya prolifera (strain JEL478) TaxID=1344416 RepID=A0A139AER1_GONPJ|nr:67 kDa myosin-cross-reactive antigen family protein [Gonapodya prolifera JEL478]|eukprot:KXS15159.1 67 kDa myosin-cross-reactive antigen family protein [Gonapodya prolifera JEL478]